MLFGGEGVEIPDVESVGGDSEKKVLLSGDLFGESAGCCKDDSREALEEDRDRLDPLEDPEDDLYLGGDGEESEDVD